MKKKFKSFKNEFLKKNIFYQKLHTGFTFLPLLARIEILFPPRAVFDVMLTRKQAKTDDLLKNLSIRLNNYFKVLEKRFTILKIKVKQKKKYQFNVFFCYYRNLLIRKENL